VVENMTGPFGRGAGQLVATQIGVPFLGEVPFDPAIVEEGDRGMPTMVTRPESMTGHAFIWIARRVAGALGWQHVSELTPA
jgi:ATP-binding protein involved in chromosome partitioning